MQEARNLIEAAYRERSLLQQSQTKEAVEWALRELDQGRLRVAEKGPSGWTVNAWVKEAILLYFGLALIEAKRCSTILP